MSSQQGQYMLQNLSNIFTQDPNSILAQLFNAIGGQLDLADPIQSNLAQQFTVSTATGAALDKIGQDWQVTRRYQESDDSYRARIKAMVPIYMSGPTKSAISSIVAGFTGGVQPVIVEYGPDSFVMGVSKMGAFVFMTNPEPFTFQVQVMNPNDVSFRKQDLINAVKNAQPARSNSEFKFYYGSTALTLCEQQ